MRLNPAVDIEFDTDVLAMLIDQLEGLSRLGHENKLVQGRLVARKRG